MTSTAPITTLIAPTSGADRTRDRIEQVGAEQPFCTGCGAPTVPVASDDGIWLACASTLEPRPTVRRLLSLETLVGHTRRLVIEDLSERLAA